MANASALNRGVRCCGGLNTYRQCSGCPQVEAHKQALAHFLREHSKDLPPEFAAFVDKEFWNLLR